MIREMARSLPPEVVALLAVAALVLIVGGPIFFVLRAVGRRLGWWPGPGTGRIRGWVWVVGIGVAVTATIIIARADLSHPALFGSLMALGLLVAALEHWRQRRTSLFRAIRRMNAGDHAGAIAELRSRIDRQRLAIGGASPADAVPDRAEAGDNFNPFAAPGAGVATAADRIRLVHDLNTLGVVESNRGAWAEALVAYDEAIALADDAPIGPILRGNRAYALIELGRPDEGLPLLRAAIADLAPADRWARAQFLTALAEKLLDRGQTDGVGDLLDRARAEGRRERVDPRAGKRAWLARVDALRARLAAGAGDPAPIATPTTPDPAPAER